VNEAAVKEMAPGLCDTEAPWNSVEIPGISPDLTQNRSILEIGFFG
jgi:hypothetical protein